MKSIYCLLFFWIMGGIVTLSAQTTLSTKRPPAVKYNQKGEYQRYEVEDAGVFRRKFSFEKPIPQSEIVDVAESDTLDRDRKVGSHFTQGNTYFIDINPFVHELSTKHPKPVVVTESPIVTTVTAPVYVPPTPKLPTKVRGFRIQIFNGQDREEANRLRNQFVSNFPETPRYLMFVEPTYRVRVGDFYTRTDAENFLREVKRVAAFADAIVIRDIVEFKPPKDGSEIVIPVDEN